MENKTNDETMLDLTKRDVWVTFAYSVLRAFLFVGWLYLMIDNAINGEGAISRIFGAACGAIAGHYGYVTIQWWKRWWRERKQLAEQREAGTIDG